MSSSKSSSHSKIMLPRTTPLVRWLAVVLFFVIVYFYHPNLNGYILPSSKALLSTVDLDELQYVKQLLKHHKIGPEIEYASRTIRYIRDASERKSMTHVDQTLFPQSFAKISITAQKSLPPSKRLDLHVKLSPRLNEVDATALLFGVSTTFERFNDPNLSPVAEWTRWLTDGDGNSNGAGLILAMLNTSSIEIETAKKQLQSAGINATVLPSNPSLDMPGRYVDLVHMLYTHPTRSQRRWFVLIDDDTFFPYMHELQRTLSAYDHTKPYYIGTFTERMDWMLNNHAPFAYGGGGIFLSLPTIQRVTQLPCTQKNEDGSYFLNADQGDRLLYNCIHQHTDITLTQLPLLHQLDQFGDPSGFYESGRQPLSLHHYKSWHTFHPEPTHRIADACGEDCVLQRFQFADNYILTNGYSLAHYPTGIDFDPGQMEHTFGAGLSDNRDFEDTVFSWAFGQLRSDLSGTGRKKAWQLLGARREGEGIVKQVYFKSRGDTRWRRDDEVAPERDSIVVLDWIP